MASQQAIEAGKAYVKIFTDISPLTRGLKRAEYQVKMFAKSMGNIGLQLFGGGAAIAGGLAFPIKIFADFDDQMRTVQAVTNSTTQELISMTDKAKELGSSTSFTAAQVAEGMGELGRIGFKPEQINVAIADVMNLSRATGTDLAKSVEIAGAVMNGFGMDASQMGHIADVLTAAANASAVSVEDLGESFKYAAPVAKAANMSFEDLSKYLGLLGNFGIKGSMAGNALKSVQKNLASLKIQNYLKKDFGIDTVDAQGNLRNLTDVLKDLNDATADLGSAKQLQIFTKVFGGEFFAAGTTLTKESAAAMFAAIQESGGLAKKSAEKMDAGIGGVIRKIGSALEGVNMSIGEAFSTVFAKISEPVQSILQTISKWIKDNTDLVVSVGAVAVASMTAGIALMGFAIAIKGLALIFIPLKIALAAISTLFSSLVFCIANPLTAAILGATAAIIAMALYISDAFKKLFQVFTEAFSGIGKTVSEAFKAIVESIRVGDVQSALNVLNAGLKLVFAQILAGIQYAWDEARKQNIGFLNSIWIGVKGLFLAVKNLLAFQVNAIVGLLQVLYEAMKKIVSLPMTAIQSIKSLFTGESGYDPSNKSWSQIAGQFKQIMSETIKNGLDDFQGLELEYNQSQTSGPKPEKSPEVIAAQKELDKAIADAKVETAKIENERQKNERSKQEPQGNALPRPSLTDIGLQITKAVWGIGNTQPQTVELSPVGKFAVDFARAIGWNFNQPAPQQVPNFEIPKVPEIVGFGSIGMESFYGMSAALRTTTETETKKQTDILSGIQDTVAGIQAQLEENPPVSFTP